MKVESGILPRVGVSLNFLIGNVDNLQAVRKTDLHAGDRVCVKTQNSIYAIRVLRNGKYLVSGGWFDRKGLSPSNTTVAGCTWGGSAIKVDLIAACGLRIEFGNRLITSPIQKIVVLPQCIQN